MPKGKGQPKKVTPRFKKLRRTYFREWRDYRGLTQEQAAERVAAFLIENGLAKGYTHASIQRLEAAKIGYTQGVLEALAHAYNTDVASLLMRDPMVLKGSSDARALWSIWDQAEMADREKIVDIAKTVTGLTGTDG
ncbi:helix-turn-helix domain-containing protein [Bradyrhizobium genosp. L]|uniref:helix-turn-helix domain-containing protein n=1 Tax=Bradyrhizobium genosp. L TaxID=83637 RepID=UPI001AEE8285|nr:helix-turn-helix transcriptional regulator [Bradyrhizobium genosp. L]